MPVFISILRGINVSGQKKILMADLKKLYEKLTYKNIETYIQSGNVIFEHDQDDHIAQKIEAIILKTYGFEVPVIVINAEDFKNRISSNPFLKEKGIDHDKLHITFLKDKYTKDDLKNTDTIIFKEDRYFLKGQTIYIYCPNGYGNTKLSNTFFEKKLHVNATTRNLKTCNELIKIIDQKY